MKKLILITSLLLLQACSDADGARETLDKAGFTNIKTQGYGWFSCDEKDFYATKFTATNVNDKVVDGVVCSGVLFKASTIRF